MPGGPAFVETLQRIWDRGDAVLPLDPRLPDPARDDLIAALRPGRLIDASGDETALAGGLAVEDGDAVVIATSGSTGTPKGVVHTHASVAASAAASSARLGVDPGRDRWLACLPLAHIGGLSVVIRALLTGTPISRSIPASTPTPSRTPPGAAPPSSRSCPPRWHASTPACSAPWSSAVPHPPRTCRPTP